MIHKRPFADDDSNEAPCKYPRQLEQIDHLALPVPVDGDCQNPTFSDGEYSLGELEDIDWSVNGRTVSNEFKNFEIGTSSSFPPFYWFSNGFHEADNLSFLPEYFDHVHHPRVVHQPDDVVSPIDHPIQKPVSVGPEHQAFVPEWEGNISVDAGYEERLMGTCVIPFPELETSATHCIDNTKTDCTCLDQGSIECVKQHITEARQKLKENLGKETFEGLGFNDMGEVVARKWSEVEEQVFHDVVLSNPVSLGRNFWEHLSVALPLRKKNELVSYFFNVFMLRIRSEQNRFDPLNIDSDNDEWQRDDSGMAVESPDEEDCNEQTEDEVGVGNGVRRAETDEEYEGDIDDDSVPRGCDSKVDYVGNNGLKGLKNNDVDVEDGSCTSYEYQQDNAADSC